MRILLPGAAVARPVTTVLARADARRNRVHDMGITVATGRRGQQRIDGRALVEFRKLVEIAIRLMDHLRGADEVWAHSAKDSFATKVAHRVGR